MTWFCAPSRSEARARGRRSHVLSLSPALAVVGAPPPASRGPVAARPSAVSLDPTRGAAYPVPVRVIARRTLRECWAQRGHGDAEQPLRAWFAEARRAAWRTPSDVKAAYRNASFVGNDRVVFNIGGNKYRLVVALKYSAQIAFIRFVGTHAAYDKIDVEEV